ncbi:MAG: hypothetical protein AB7O97_14555 [Planctomycetota bacterium]
MLRIALPTLLASLSVAANAQCELQWQPGLGGDGIVGVALATCTWDPDGPGPAGSVIVVGGRFEAAGSVLANNIAAFDPATGQWSTLGTGVDLGVFSLLATSTGELVAGGSFTTAGGVVTNGVARWDGTAWHAFGSGVTQGPNTVYALTEVPGGDVVAASSFAQGIGVASTVARWRGGAWQTLATGIGGTVRALAATSTGVLVAGGSFTAIGGVSAAAVATYDGTQWTQLGNGLTGEVRAVHVAADGRIWIGNGNGVWRHDGVSFPPVGVIPAAGGTTGAVHAICSRPNGDIVIGGAFLQVDGLAARFTARHDGTAWHPLSAGTDRPVSALATLANGDVVAAGDFAAAGDLGAHQVARWDGAWHPLGGGTNGPALCALAIGGETIVGGTFTQLDGIPARRIARFDGTSWHPLGSGVNGRVNALAMLPDGRIVAGGLFSEAGGVPAQNIAAWDGTSWQALGAGMNGSVAALAVRRNGYLIAGGVFTTADQLPAQRLANWDGTRWTPLGTGLTGGFLFTAATAMAVLPDDSVAVGGSFAFAGGIPAANVARWTGSSWSSMGSGLTFVTALAMHRGNLLASNSSPVTAGNLSSNLVRFVGGAWTPFAPGLSDGAHAMLSLPNGDLLAAAVPPNGGPRHNVVRYSEGAGTWTPVDGDVDGTARGLALHPGGDITCVGDFARADGQLSVSIAHLAPPCRATSTPAGAGCTTTTGPLALAPDTQPWIGGAFTSTATGFAPDSFAVWELGTGPLSTPVSAIHPAGGPGCTQWINPDVMTSILFPQNGALTVGVSLPNEPTLIGLVLWHQVAGIEVDPVTFAITHIATSDALQLTFGAL